MKVHHIGYAVKNIDGVITKFRKLGFKNKNKYCGESPVSSILRKNGLSYYHICYKIENVDNTMEDLKKGKFMAISLSSTCGSIR